MIDHEMYIRISTALASAMSAVLGASLSSSGLKPHEDTSTGDIVFAFSKKRKTLAIVSILFWVAYLGFTILIGGVPPEEFTSFLIFLAFMATMVAIGTIRLLKALYRITKDGIDKHSWFRHTFVPWADIEAVHIGGFGSGSRFTIKSSKGRVILNTNMAGFKVVATAIKDNVSYEKWQKAQPVIEEIIAR
ncbi:MAG TPA: PH domain-containing protein [Anaerolineae bacterium]|jgi:hypothetical protein|nr:PH domain-containing protein [Anaerolineae bacterium]